jgi:hypothetical protein
MQYSKSGTCAWWEAENEDDTLPDPVHRVLFGHLQALEEDQSEIHLTNLLNAKLYSNRELMAFEWTSQISSSFRPLNANMENLVQSSVDGLHSMLASNRPRAKTVTRGADFGLYKQGRLLDRFIWGESQHHDVWSKGERAFIYDPMIYGTGFLKIDIDEGSNEVFMERVHPDEIVVDQRECVSAEMPLCLIQRKLVSRLWLRTVFKSDKAAVEAINAAQTKEWRYTSYRTPAEDQVVLVQAWKRPTYKGAGDGRMVLCIENYTFRAEKYDRDVFPFVITKWRDPENGFYGLPLVSDIMGYQINQNEMNDLFKHGRDLACVPRIFVEQGSDVQIHSIDNSVAKFIRYRGTMPECVTWPAFNPEMYNERDRNRSNAYEFIGLSQATAQATAPTSGTRFDSSEALREHRSQQDGRLIKHVMKLEKAYLEAAKHTIELTAQLYKNKAVDRKTAYLSHNLLQQISWSDVDMDRDRFVLQVAASSVLNMTPAARTDKLERWLAEGKITMEQYHSLSGEPDLERMTDRLAAQSDHIEHMVDQMLKGIPQTPTEFDNLEMGFNIVHDELMRIMSLDAPPEIIDLFIQWLEMAKELMQPTPEPMPQMADPAMQMAAPGMAPPMGGPPGMSGAPVVPPAATPGVPGAIVGVGGPGITAV